MVRRYEQGEQLPLFVGSRSSLVHFGEEQYRDYGTHRTQGLDSMVRVVWCDDLNRVFSRHRDYRTDRTPGLDSMVRIVWCDEQGEQVPLLAGSRSSLALVHPDFLWRFETRT